MRLGKGHRDTGRLSTELRIAVSFTSRPINLGVMELLDETLPYMLIRTCIPTGLQYEFRVPQS